MTIRFLVLAGALLLAGCVTCYHRGTATGNFAEDKAACEAKQEGGAHLNMNGRNEAMEACMKEKGWEPEHR